MPSERISGLLTLQLRDMEVTGFARELKAWPERKKALELENARIEQTLFEQRGRLRALESRRDALELETRANEEKTRKLRLQQLEVKKNEEYQALEHEIAALAEKSDAVEDEELAVLEEIDQAGVEFRHYAGEAAGQKEALAAKLRNLEATLQEKETGLAEVQERASAARAKVSPELLGRYDQLRRELRFPVVVPLVKQTCSGCHLRVSNEVEGEANQKDFAICDSCGRIVFIE